ncbi:BTAD domain-containing putative transcriptional regulator [Salininema proteolyticum]|uniref:BTAD domain-containing putative transcriptional regulator n=1 Tax=Salininema proteolyticum TaxID=1607685 RepID=A0ABV8U3C0_9ACTN
MRFGILGPLAIWDADGASVALPERKARMLLAALLIDPGRLVSDDRLADILWRGEPPAKPGSSLRALASRLRSALRGAGVGEALARRASGYLLDVAASHTDAAEFERAISRSRGEPDARERAALLSEALDLWRGEPFADFSFEDFAQAPARRLEELRLEAVELLAKSRLELGEAEAAVADLAPVALEHPTRESLREVQLKALYLSGNQHEALNQYEQVRAALADELGADPGPALQRLHTRILRQDADLAPPPRRRGNLPEPLTGLIGREDELARAGAALDESRLATLVGPGGVGKTRLALAVGAERGEDVWMADLTPARGGSDVVTVTAAALGVRDDGGPRPLTGRIASALDARPTLLILDNCEHVVGDAAGLTESLLAAAPACKVLATGREPLRLPGERVLPVEPFAPPESSDIAVLRGNPASLLFAERARAADPGFTLDDGEAVAVICRRLDGIPLALELAASRLRGIGTAELAARLDRRFSLLTGRGGGAPDRQRTLRAAIDWSWNLLEEDEKVLLRRLSVFGGVFSLSSAEAVCGGAGLAEDSVVLLLGSLVDRSLVARPGGRGYALLESIAAYGSEKLAEAGEAEEFARRLRHRGVDLCRGSAERLRGPGQRGQLGLLDTESDVLREAFDSSIAAGDLSSAFALANESAWYWFLRGRLSEAHRWFARALESESPALAAPLSAPFKDVRSALRSEARAWRGLFAAMLGERELSDEGTPLDVLVAEVEESRRAELEWFLEYVRSYRGVAAPDESRLTRLVGAVESDWGTAAALLLRSRHRLMKGRLAGAEEDAAASRSLFSERDDRWGRLQSADVLASAAEARGDLDGAQSLREEGLALAREWGMAVPESYQLSGLGRLALLSRDFAGSAELHARAFATAAGDTSAEMFALYGMALSLRRNGDLDEAERRFGECLAWSREMEDEPGVALCLAELGFIAESRSDGADAAELHRQSLESARRTDDPRAMALAVEGLAGAASLAGSHGAAARLLGVADAARTHAGAPLPENERGDVDRIEARLSTAFSADGLSEAFTAGGELVRDRIAEGSLVADAVMAAVADAERDR